MKNQSQALIGALLGSFFCTLMVVLIIFLFSQPDWKYNAIVYGGGSFLVFTALFYANNWLECRCTACGTAWTLNVQGEQNIDNYNIRKSGKNYRRRVYLQHTQCTKCGENNSRKRKQDTLL